MAEAEDVITDAARHATIFAQDLWRRRRSARVSEAPLQLADVSRRLDLLLEAVFGRSFTIRTAQLPARRTVLARLVRRHAMPVWHEAIGATDGLSLWLPATLGEHGSTAMATERFRLLALRQAIRAVRGSALSFPATQTPMVRDMYLLLEALACDDALAVLLPGTAPSLLAFRRDALLQRPSLDAFSPLCQSFERGVRQLLSTSLDQAVDVGCLFGCKGLAPVSVPATPVATLALAQAACRVWLDSTSAAGSEPWLWRDQWTGELRVPGQGVTGKPTRFNEHEFDDEQDSQPRSARLKRRPEVRDGNDDEDDPSPGAWMVQTAAPHETAADPMGLSRPTDRDTDTEAGDFADALSELPEARLVCTPGKPKEYLLSDDPPDARSRPTAVQTTIDTIHTLTYPEWNWRTGNYRYPGATVRLLPAVSGPGQWLEDTLIAHSSVLHEIRRRFEFLRNTRTRLYRQHDGDNIDLAAYVENQAAYRAGQPLDQRLYTNEKRTRRDLAVLLLVDVSGSTDSLISGGKRIIDIEREALLLVCLALDGLNAPFSVQAFSGEGPQGVTMRSVKSFAERYSEQVGRKIAGLEPELYTRAGAAIRHATALLMREPAERRLLLMLSDGKPNDVDDYEGRAGVEDMRQAVQEASLQGIAPFCLTVDRQAARYMPFVFGPHRYALLHRPELLPGVLLDWLRRLLA